ncbi:MAG: SusC/RagA family TonB-linked outer membrane protein [Bacteroidales bacterium]|jgi:TonB-linked SusC/RagA family outer membrane protein|nr:SusC/RagA family TonB-linked outer membrane protein [Bacteroidales bacterium]
MNRLKLLIALFVFTGFSALMAQTVTIKGTVTSADDGLPIPSVAVTVKGTTLGTLTDFDGKYSITAPSGAQTMTFTFVGMKTVTETIGGRATIDVVMQTDMLGLDEVVVTALGITREKKALGYSVSDVKGDAVANTRETNIVNALQGLAPGVQITRASSSVGSSSQILIRGIKSFGDNQPLWVVDGTPISNSASGAGQYGGVDFGNNAADIDPENVESISILKGANAAALYGSRARNGVVLVTTKKGKAGQVKVSFSNSTAFDRVAYLPTYQNEYGQGTGGSEFNWAEAGEGLSYQQYCEENAFTYVDGMGGGVFDFYDESWGPRLDAGLLLAQFNSPYDEETGTYTPTPWISHPDNVKSFFETGLTMSTSLSLEGGNDVFSGRLNFTNQTERGIIPNTDQDRNQLGLSTTANISPKLQAVVNINYAITTNDNLPGQGYDENNIMQSIGGWFGRQVDMTDLKENWKTWGPNGMPYNWNSNYHNNPYWTVYKNTTSRKRERVYGNISLSYQLTDWLSLMGRYGVDYYNEYRKSVTYEGSIESLPGNGGYFSQNNRDNKEANADLFLNFQKDFGTRFQLSGNIGANYRRVDYNYSALSAAQLTVPNWFDIANVKGTPGTDMYMSEYESNSIFASANIGYMNQLFLDLTARNDWSSTLPPANWSYPYWSASLGWIFTETFGLGGDILSYGKLRASYAKVGSDTSPYQVLNVYNSVSPAYNGITQFDYPSRISPANLKPEQTASTEFGLEMKFFNNRLGFDLSYFNMVTTDQIMTVNVSTSSGFLTKAINAGEIETGGFEVALSGEIIRKSDFMWSAIINWTKTQTTVNELAPGVTSYVLNSSWSPTTIEARPGEPFGQIYGIAYLRDEDGNRLVEDGYYQATSSPVVCGNTQPDWIGSMNNMFKYKNFNANVLVDVKWGGDLYSVTKWFGDYAGITEATVKNNLRETGAIADGIDVATNQKNEVAVDPEYFFGDYWGKTEPAVIDGTYIKLREISIGYDIRLKNSFIKMLNIGIYGRNLALLYRDPSNDIRIDPEAAYGTGTAAVGVEQYTLPPVRTTGFKLRVDF